MVFLCRRESVLGLLSLLWIPFRAWQGFCSARRARQPCAPPSALPTQGLRPENSLAFVRPVHDLPRRGTCFFVNVGWRARQRGGFPPASLELGQLGAPMWFCGDSLGDVKISAGEMTEFSWAPLVFRPS